MNPLIEVIPAAARKYVYAIVSFAALVWGVFEVSNGDWQKFVGGLIVALTTATAASNVTAQGGYWGGVRASSSDSIKED